MMVFPELAVGIPIMPVAFTFVKNRFFGSVYSNAKEFGDLLFLGFPSVSVGYDPWPNLYR
jgi:hypothetical protein